MNALILRSHSPRRNVAALLICIAAMLLTGCETAPSRWQDASKKEINSAMAEASKEHVTVPPDISQALTSAGNNPGTQVDICQCVIYGCRSCGQQTRSCRWITRFRSFIGECRFIRKIITAE